jgi:hypothetical protein
MKIKQYIHITDPAEFLRGDYHSCFTLFDLPNQHSKWLDGGPIELDINIDHDKATATVIDALDKEIESERAEHSLKMDMLQTRKDELLALTHEPNPAADFERDGERMYQSVVDEGERKRKTQDE